MEVSRGRQQAHYLLVSMVIRVDVVVKLLMLIILFVTQLTVEVGLEVLQGFGQGFLLLSIILKQKETA